MEKIAIFQEVQTGLIIYNKENIRSCNIVHIGKYSGNITTVMTLIFNKEDYSSTTKLFFENKNEGEKFNTLINSIIKSNPEKIVDNKIQDEPKNIKTDKLLQLFEMYKQGLLTEEEFNKQKQLLL